MKRIFRSLSLILLVALLSGCSLNLVSYGSWTPGHIKSTYLYKSGWEGQALNGSSGQTLSLDYQAKVNFGKLALDVIDAEGKSLWAQEITQSGDGEGEIKLPVDGIYTIRVTGERTSGSYQIDWSVK